MTSPRRPFRTPIAILAAAAALAGAAAPAPPAERAMQAHVAFLAADALKGREAGSAEYDIAAEYVAARFLAAGLRAGGEKGSFLQPVPLVRYRVREGATAVVGATALTPGVDFTAAGNPAGAAVKVSAPVVFVGQGVVSPGRDDYAGVDVRGRIVAVAPGAPAAMTGEERAFFGATATKAQIAGARGAIGVVTLARPGPPEPPRPGAPAAEERPWRVTWAGPDGKGQAAAGAAPVLGALTAAGAGKLFAAAGLSWRKLGAAKATPRAVALPVTLAMASETEAVPLRSANVVGVLPGSDPALAREVVVLSAHLDHVGVNATADANGDTINNGALDDAIGIASLIEAAARFAAGPAPRRTIAFLAVTAEEKGLVGSDYFVRHRPAGLEEIVADVNLDMPILTYRFEDLVAFGGDRSTLGPIIARAAAGAGVTLSPDPMPEEGIFLRSDHFRFVQQGIPAVFLWPGQKGPGKAAVSAFMARCYHRPCDDLAHQPILWDQAVRFVDLNHRIAREIADAPARPTWNAGDYFGTLFKGPMGPAAER